MKVIIENYKRNSWGQIIPNYASNRIILEVDCGELQLLLYKCNDLMQNKIFEVIDIIDGEVYFIEGQDKRYIKPVFIMQVKDNYFLFKDKKIYLEDYPIFKIKTDESIFEIFELYKNKAIDKIENIQKELNQLKTIVSNEFIAKDDFE